MLTITCPDCFLSVEIGTTIHTGSANYVWGTCSGCGAEFRISERGQGGFDVDCACQLDIAIERTSTDDEGVEWTDYESVDTTDDCDCEDESEPEPETQTAERIFSLTRIRTVGDHTLVSDEATRFWVTTASLSDEIEVPSDDPDGEKGCVGYNHWCIRAALTNTHSEYFDCDCGPYPADDEADLCDECRAELANEGVEQAIADWRSCC